MEVREGVVVTMMPPLYIYLRPIRWLERAPGRRSDVEPEGQQSTHTHQISSAYGLVTSASVPTTGRWRATVELVANRINRIQSNRSEMEVHVTESTTSDLPSCTCLLHLEGRSRSCYARHHHYRVHQDRSRKSCAHRVSTELNWLIVTSLIFLLLNVTEAQICKRNGPTRP